MLRSLGKPIRTVLCWQLAATAAFALCAGLLSGGHAAVSAAAGGLISVIAGLAAAIVAARGTGKSAGGILIGALRAEAVKIVLIVLLLWLVLATYRDVEAVAFFGTFLVTILIFAMAFFVRES